MPGEMIPADAIVKKAAAGTPTGVPPAEFVWHFA
jgi:hypothetical protein